MRNFRFSASHVAPISFAAAYNTEDVAILRLQAPRISRGRRLNFRDRLGSGEVEVGWRGAIDRTLIRRKQNNYGTAYVILKRERI